MNSEIPWRHSEFQATKSYSVKPYLKKKPKKTQKSNIYV